MSACPVIDPPDTYASPSIPMPQWGQRIDWLSSFTDAGQIVSAIDRLAEEVRGLRSDLAQGRVLRPTLEDVRRYGGPR